MGKIRYLLNKSVPFQCSRAQQLSSFVDKGLCGKRVLLLLLPALKFLLRHVSWIFVMKGLFDSFFFLYFLGIKVIFMYNLVNEMILC